MNYWQINAYIDASERDTSERLVMLMNVMAVAFGGSARDRKKMADGLLGKADQMDMKDFENIFSNLATPVDLQAQDEAKQWAATEFDPNDSAFKVK
jgi:hypothetical protein